MTVQITFAGSAAEVMAEMQQLVGVGIMAQAQQGISAGPVTEASAAVAQPAEAPDKPLDKMTIKELEAYMEANGMTPPDGWTGMNKAEKLAHLRGDDTPAETEEQSAPPADEPEAPGEPEVVATPEDVSEVMAKLITEPGGPDHIKTVLTDVGAVDEAGKPKRSLIPEDKLSEVYKRFNEFSPEGGSVFGDMD